MKLRSLWSCLTLFLGTAMSLGTAIPAAAQENAADRKITVTIDSPDPFEPAYGAVQIEAAVGGEEEVARVVFYVDGVVMGEASSPPYRLDVHLGEDVQSHRFEVMAYGVGGTTAIGGLTTPTIEVDEEVSVNLQQLYVTVTRKGETQSQERVLDLQSQNFAIFDERNRQELITFARGDIPFTALVLLDSSHSMRGEKLRSALGGAETFFRNMRPLDEGKLLVFSDRILHTTPFTTFPDVLTAGLSQVQAKGGTALNDHLYLALKQLATRQGRRVILLLSDGIDPHSVLSMKDILPVARRSQALIYWLRLPHKKSLTDEDSVPSITSPWRSSANHQAEFEMLRKTVLESGGKIRPLQSIEEIAPAFQEILAELREQYVLGYYPSVANQNGQWRKVTVRVQGDGLQVRSRGGYLDL